MGDARRIVLAAIAAALLVLAAGCGEDEGSPATGAPPPEMADGNRGEEKDGSADGEDGGDRADGGDGSRNRSAGSGPSEERSDAPPIDPAPLSVSGGGSEQFRSPGGDNSVQEFGEEGEESELEAAARVLYGYTLAQAEEDWEGACSYLAETLRQQLAQLASRSERLRGADCGEILATLTPPRPRAVRRESTEIDAGSLRIDGERAFLIYRDADEEAQAVTLVSEDGEWKLASLSSVPLP